MYHIYYAYIKDICNNFTLCGGNMAIRKTQILAKADEITKRANIVIPLYNRNCFISIIPENNRY